MGTTFLDISGILLAAAVLSLFTVAPGYVVGWLLNLFDLRTRTLLAQLAIAVCLSIAFAPIFLYFIWRFTPNLLWPAALLPMLFALVLWLRGTRASTQPPRRMPREYKIVLAILGAWVALGAASLADLQIGHRLYVSIVSYDYALRTAFTSAIARTGVPPQNPYFNPGRSYPIRYHYLWYMLCALAVRITGGRISPRIAVAAGTVWSGIALVALLALYLRLSPADPHSRRPRRLLITVGLLAVTGLDILPLTAIFLISHRLNASSEWWNELILSWPNTAFWQPHTLISLVACMTGLLALLWASSVASRRARITAAILCGAAFASAVGLSLYVAFVFTAFLFVWSALLFIQRRTSDAAAALGALAALAIFVSPFLLELAHGAVAQAAAASRISLTVRSFYFAEALARAVAPTHPWLVPLLNFVFLPVNYFFELGLYFVAAVVYAKHLRRSPLTQHDTFELTLLVVSLLVATFLRSGLIANNDLGWRAIIAAQLVLLLWAARLWDSSDLRPSFHRPGVLLLVALGLAATIYDTTMLRLYPVLLDNFSIPRYAWLAPDHHLGERTYALRQAYQALDRILPSSALIQQNPNANPQDLFFGLYANRATLIDMPTCGVSFGGSAALCAQLHPQVDALFHSPSPVSPAKLDPLCNRFTLSAIVVKDTDPVWRDRTSWVWHRAPQWASPYARVFLCGPAAPTHSGAALP